MEKSDRDRGSAKADGWARSRARLLSRINARRKTRLRQASQRKPRFNGRQRRDFAQRTFTPDHVVIRRMAISSMIQLRSWDGIRDIAVCITMGSAMTVARMMFCLVMAGVMVTGVVLMA